MIQRVLVSEDIILWSKMLDEQFEDETGIVQFHTCSSAGELIALLEHKWDAIIVDNYLPLAHGQPVTSAAIAIVAEITKRYGRTGPPRLLWTPQADPLLVYTFMAYGGYDYLDKTHYFTPESIARKVRALINGERWQEPVKPLATEENDRLVRRWRRLLALLAAGHRSKDIAAELDTSPATVATTVQRLAEALGVNRDSGVLSLALPRAAKQAGYLWVPRPYWDLAPDTEPWPGELSRRARRTVRDT